MCVIHSTMGSCEVLWGHVKYSWKELWLLSKIELYQKFVINVSGVQKNIIIYDDVSKGLS